MLTTSSSKTCQHMLWNIITFGLHKVQHNTNDWHTTKIHATLARFCQPTTAQNIWTHVTIQNTIINNIIMVTIAKLKYTSYNNQMEEWSLICLHQDSHSFRWQSVLKNIQHVTAYVIVVTQGRVHCLICMHNARGHAAPKGERVQTYHWYQAMYDFLDSNYYATIPMRLLYLFGNQFNSIMGCSANGCSQSNYLKIYCQSGALNSAIETKM